MPDTRTPWISPRPDFGVRRLASSWRDALRGENRRDDRIAGLTATGLSLSLALVLAHHAGLPATATLVSAVLGGLIAAFFGGWTFGVAGPGIATGVVIARIVQQHGTGGLLVAVFLVGALQLAMGVLGLGRLARLVPLIVVHGFTLGMGLLVLVFCLPYVLGVDAPGEISAAHTIDHAGTLVHAIHWTAVLIAAGSCALTAVGLRWLRKVPMSLVAIALATLAVRFLHLTIPTVPDLPVAFPTVTGIHFPAFRATQFVASTLALFVFVTLETSLSASAEEQRSNGARYDPDQELIATGLSNLVVPLFGGSPTAGSVIRARALRTFGANTRGAAIVHALALAALFPLVLVVDRWIPLAALAGVLVAHGAYLLDARPLRSVWRVSRPHAVVVAITALAIVFTSVLTGLETGLFLALVLAMARVAVFRSTLHRGADGGAHQVTLDGPMTFLSLPSLESLRYRLLALDVSNGVIIDARNVLAMDYSGCHEFVSLVNAIADRGGNAAVLGAAPSVKSMLLAEDARGIVAPRLAVSERDVDRILGRKGAFHMRALVTANLERFRGETREHYESLFEQLAEGQNPHTLFITCVDSRVSPVMLTGAHPGEVFIVRCLGAMVPPPVDGASPDEGAAIEYAVGVLGVRNIVVCGHSGCGAVKAAKTGNVPEELVTLRKWLASAPLACGDLSAHEDADDAARATTVRQVENVKQYPLVRARLDDGAIELHAWFYDVAQAELYEWREATGRFEVFRGSNVSLEPDAHDRVETPAT